MQLFLPHSHDTCLFGINLWEGPIVHVHVPAKCVAMVIIPVERGLGTMRGWNIMGWQLCPLGGHSNSPL